MSDVQRRLMAARRAADGHAARWAAAVVQGLGDVAERELADMRAWLARADEIAAELEQEATAAG